MMSDLAVFTARTIGEPFWEFQYSSLEELRRHFTIYAEDVLKLLQGADVPKSWGNRNWVLSKHTDANAANTGLHQIEGNVDHV